MNILLFSFRPILEFQILKNLWEKVQNQESSFETGNSFSLTLNWRYLKEGSNFCKLHSVWHKAPWTQDVNWTYIRRSEDVLDVMHCNLSDSSYSTELPLQLCHTSTLCAYCAYISTHIKVISPSKSKSVSTSTKTLLFFHFSNSISSSSLSSTIIRIAHNPIPKQTNMVQKLPLALLQQLS